MHDTFPREAATNPEPFTGERLTASIHGQVEIEHYHRYLFARAFCRGKDVLDVASGEGYGAAQLAQVARFVVGVEFAAATALSASENFPAGNPRFVRGDARSLPLADACVDVVTSFETIEHFDRQDDFVAEVRRVLRPGGCFIVSTPDRDVYSKPGAPLNPYHVIEFDRDEFLHLLRRHFPNVSLSRQRPILGSALVPEEATTIAPLLFERRDASRFEAHDVLPRAPYLVAIASGVTLPAAPFSLYIDRDDLDNAMNPNQDDHARAMEAARRDVARAEAEARAAASTLAQTRAALAEANAELGRLSGSLRQFMRQYVPKAWRWLFG